MKITIIRVGKTGKKYFIEAENEYLKRLRPFAEINILEVKEAEHGSNPAPAEVEQIKLKEAQSIHAKTDGICLTRVKTAPKLQSFIIAMDEHGIQYTSPKFAELIRQKRDQIINIIIIIGGCYGLHQSVLDSSDLILSFSRFTFTHQMIRPLLLEQIYRAFTIISGKTYHY